MGASCGQAWRLGCGPPQVGGWLGGWGLGVGLGGGWVGAGWGRVAGCPARGASPCQLRAVLLVMRAPPPPPLSRAYPPTLPSPAPLLLPAPAIGRE